MSSALSNILRRSRLAHVPTSSAPFLNPVRQTVPQHQVIETKPSTLHRMEWGLKASLPRKIRNRYIVYKELDNQERVTNFEPVGQHQWSRVKFQELGIPVNCVSENGTNPLFSGASAKYYDGDVLLKELDVSERSWTMKRNTLRRKLEALRPKFQEWLAKKYPEAMLARHKIDPKLLRLYAANFLSETATINNPDLKNISEWKIVGSGGLSYGLKGRLRQSPEGVVTGSVAPGRFLNLHAISPAVAVCGFVAKPGPGRMARKLDSTYGDYIVEQKYPFLVKSASMSEDGKLMLDLRMVEAKSVATKMKKVSISETFSQSTQMRNFRKKNQAEIQKLDPAESAMHAEELLSILTNFKN